MKQPQLLKIYCTNHARSGYGKEDITVEKFLENTICYNRDGKILKEENFLSDNELDTVVINEYNEEGVIVSTAQYDGQQELIQKTTYVYDEKGHLQSQDNYFGEGAPVYTTRNIYENDMLVRQDAYEKDKFINTEKTFAYDERKLLSRMIEFDEDGNQLYVTSEEYNQDRLLVKRVREEIMEKDRRTYIYEYDDRRNRTKELIYDYENILISKTYYQYNEDNKIVTKEEEDLDHYQNMIYSYENGNMVKAVAQDKAGKTISWIEYNYDDDGEITDLRYYGRDETDENSFRLMTEYQYERQY